MNVKAFLQTCVNNGVFAVTTKEVATALRISHNDSYKQLQALNKEGVVMLINKNRHSFWDIDLPTCLPHWYEETLVSDLVLGDCDAFALATMNSMWHNHVRKTVRPKGKAMFSE